MQDDIFIFTYGREYIKVRSLKVRWRQLSFEKKEIFLYLINIYMIKYSVIGISSPSH